MRALTARRLLLIEDDPTIAELLAYNLRHAGYEVIHERDGRAGLQAALSYEVDLAIIDVLLPELDGFALTEEVARRKPGLRIIILTALTERDSMLQGFGVGADDFVVKPFDFDELLARIEARLRHAGGPGKEPREPATLVGLFLDSDSHVARSATGEVSLKPKEHDLLELLLSSPGHLFRREEIVHRVWHQQFSPVSRTLDVHVRHLRGTASPTTSGMSDPAPILTW